MRLARRRYVRTSMTWPTPSARPCRGTRPSQFTGMLAREGLLHDARHVVMVALAKDPDEPSLHTLLGQIYEKSGLPEQAAESFDEAQFLLTKGAN